MDRPTQILPKITIVVPERDVDGNKRATEVDSGRQVQKLRGSHKFTASSLGTSDEMAKRLFRGIYFIARSKLIQIGLVQGSKCICI